MNDASLVLRLAFAGRAVLFPGNLEADGEGELCGRRSLGQTVRSDVLKVPHHGSRTSSSDELLDAVEPELAVISLGWRNRFHFPAPEVLARYAGARGADAAHGPGRRGHGDRRAGRRPALAASADAPTRNRLRTADR